MRALLVDDQPEFYESVRPILSAAKFQCELAATADQAINLASQQIFDLVLVDLQMPPGNWGGLEVIKMVHAEDRFVPVVVVSGMGSLSECISAMRLGAWDYIRKEEFAKEFDEIVAPIYQKAYAVPGYPSIISYTHREFENEKNSYMKARRLIDVFEFSVRLLCLMAISEVCRNTHRSHENVLAELGLGRPALGSYVKCLFDLMAGEKAGEFLGILRRSPLKRLRAVCDVLTKCRNENFGHSATISDMQAASIVAERQADLVTFLNSVSFLRKFVFLMAESLRFDGISYTAEALFLRGPDLTRTYANIIVSEPVCTGHIIVVTKTSPLVDLHPLLEVKPLPVANQLVFEVYDKLVDGVITRITVPATRRSEPM